MAASTRSLSRSRSAKRRSGAPPCRSPRYSPGPAHITPPATLPRSRLFRPPAPPVTSPPPPPPLDIPLQSPRALFGRERSRLDRPPAGRQLVDGRNVEVGEVGHQSQDDTPELPSLT